MELPLPRSKYGDHGRRQAVIEAIVERVRSIPGVVEAGITTNLPLQEVSFDAVFQAEGQVPVSPTDVPITAHRLVSNNYLEALGVKLTDGRFPDERDHADSQPVVVVSEEFARQAWPGDSPIGKRVRRVRPGQTELPLMTVIGVIGDIKEDRFNFRIERPSWYLPHSQQSGLPALPAPLNLLVRNRWD